MKPAYLTIALVALLAAASWCDDKTPQQKVDELRQRAESAHGADRAKLYADLVRHEVELANQQYDTGDHERAEATVRDLSSHADECRKAAMESGKDLKRIDLLLRASVRRLDDIRRTLPFDDQPPVKAASQHIEDLRAELLDRMFGLSKPAKEKR